MAFRYVQTDGLNLNVKRFSPLNKKLLQYNISRQFAEEVGTMAIKLL